MTLNTPGILVLILLVQILAAVLIAIVGWAAKDMKRDIRGLTESLASVKEIIYSDYIRKETFETHKHEVREDVNTVRDHAARLETRLSVLEHFKGLD